MNRTENQFEKPEERNVREFGHYMVEKHTDGGTILRRPGTTGPEGILPRDKPMSGAAIARWRKQRGQR